MLLRTGRHAAQWGKLFLELMVLLMVYITQTI